MFDTTLLELAQRLQDTLRSTAKAVSSLAERLAMWADAIERATSSPRMQDMLQVTVRELLEWAAAIAGRRMAGIVALAAEALKLLLRRQPGFA